MNLKSTSPMQEGKTDANFDFGIFISIVWLNWACTLDFDNLMEEIYTM